MVSAEHFFLWVIEGDDKLKKQLPFELTDYDVKIVEDLQPYRTRKVRILNGAHTAMVPFSLLYGNETVQESVEDDFTGPFVRNLIFGEIMPGLDMPKDTLGSYAEAVLERFKNPFIVHKLSSIALNSISKFKVRVLPSLLDYVDEKGELPVRIVYAFACLLRFYQGQWQEKVLPVHDDAAIVADFKQLWSTETLPNLAQKVLSKTDYWGQDLNQVEGLASALVLGLEAIAENGIKDGFSKYQQQFNP
jgi:tagaturonate reductase